MEFDPPLASLADSGSYRIVVELVFWHAIFSVRHTQRVDDGVSVHDNGDLSDIVFDSSLSPSFVLSRWNILVVVHVYGLESTYTSLKRRMWLNQFADLLDFECDVIQNARFADESSKL